MRIHVCLIGWINFDSKENVGKKSFSCKIKTLISCALIRKRCSCYLIMKIIARIHVHHVLVANLDSKENYRKKGFSCETNESISRILVKKMCFCSPIMKIIKIIMSIQVCLIWWMNFDHKENVGKMSFSCKSKASISASQLWENDCSAHDK